MQTVRMMHDRAMYSSFKMPNSLLTVQEVYALLLTHAPHLLAESSPDLRAFGSSSSLLRDAESLYIKYMSASAPYSVR